MNRAIILNIMLILPISMAIFRHDIYSFITKAPAINFDLGIGLICALATMFVTTAILRINQPSGEKAPDDIFINTVGIIITTLSFIPIVLGVPESFSITRMVGIYAITLIPFFTIVWKIMGNNSPYEQKIHRVCTHDECQKQNSAGVEINNICN